MNNEFLQTEEAIVAMLKTVYDPEIPVNVYDLGLMLLLMRIGILRWKQ